MKTLDKIPTSKIERAGQLVKTGLKVGGNYISYYSEKIIHPNLTVDKLNENNAEDIYDGLKNLKGSALKVAQMLSMDKNIMPKAYIDKFSLSQFSVPPLSAPLVRKTFKKYLGQFPEEIFETFSPEAINAASIGQVHLATKDNQKLAVKIQYPGVAECISSDLALVKPFAIRMFNLKGKDSDKYFQEVESKLIEETDYNLELKDEEKMFTTLKKSSEYKKLTDGIEESMYPKGKTRKFEYSTVPLTNEARVKEQKDLITDLYKTVNLNPNNKTTYIGKIKFD
jgi:predicted unusual protein kinase regulating ubiquinone biosynthesis (AarF/ABC1/UbiB family)